MLSVFDEKAKRLARLFTAICLGDFEVVPSVQFGLAFGFKAVVGSFYVEL